MAEILIWTVPAAVLVAGIRSPRGGLLVLAASWPLFGSPPGGPYQGALDVAALLAIGTAWRGGRTRPSALDWPVLAFVVVSAFSLLPLAYRPPSWSPFLIAKLIAALPGVEPWTALYGWRALANLALGVGLMIGVRRAFERCSLRPLFLAASVGLAATLFLGLMSHAGLVELGNFRVKGSFWQSRLHSLFFHSGWLAEYVVLTTPIAVAALLASGRRHAAAAGLLIALALATLFLTEQRGAWLSALGQLAIAVPLVATQLAGDWRRLGRRLAAGASIALALAVGGVLIQPGLFDAAVARTQSAFETHNRFRIWSLTGEMLAERPVSGWGLGSYSPVFHQTHPERAGAVFDILTAHNQYLMLAVERGLLALMAFALVLWGVWTSLQVARKSVDQERRLLAAGLLVSQAGFVFYGLFQYLFFLKMIEWWFWMLVGSAAALATGSRTVSGELGTRTTRRLSKSLLIGAGLLLVYRLIAIAPSPAAGDRSFGWHRLERTGSRNFQWTEGYAARRFPRPTGAFVIELANGHPAAKSRPIEVTVRIDGEERLTTTITGSWERHSLSLGESKRDWLLLELSARPTFRPFRDFRRFSTLTPSTDVRSLGVAVSFPNAAPGRVGGRR